MIQRKKKCNLHAGTVENVNFEKIIFLNVIFSRISITKRAAICPYEEAMDRRRAGKRVDQNHPQAAVFV